MCIRTIMVAALALCIGAFSAGAQTFPVDGTVYLSFEPDSRVQTKELQFFLIAEITSGAGIAGIEGSVTLPSSVVIQSGPAWMFSGALDLGPFYPIPDGVNFICGLGECVDTTNGPVAMFSVTAQFMGGGNVGILVAPPLGAANPSSFAGIGPGWVDCVGGMIGEEILFDQPAMSNGIIINPTVPTEQVTWGAIKALY
jgi:hypothetical protein